MDLGLWGDLAILAVVLEVVFATCVFVYIRRLENRTPAPLGEQVGAHKAVLAKLRKREPMSQPEFDYATELVTDARSPLAYAIPQPCSPWASSMWSAACSSCTCTVAIRRFEPSSAASPC